MIDESNVIHPTATLEGDISLGKNNTIGANSVLIGKITIGDNNTIGPNCSICNTVKIGNGNHLLGLCSVGTQGEMGTKGDILLEDGIILIGNDNVFREFLTVNSPVRRETTFIGDKCYFMARTHIAHDCQVSDNVVMATNSLIGGGTAVDQYAYVGLGSITHQWIDIGESALVGMQAANTRHVPPYAIVTGITSRILKFNRVGVERRGLPKKLIDQTESNYLEIIKGNHDFDNQLVSIIKKFSNEHPDMLTKFVGE